MDIRNGLRARRFGVPVAENAVASAFRQVKELPKAAFVPDKFAGRFVLKPPPVGDCRECDKAIKPKWFCQVFEY